MRPFIIFSQGAVSQVPEPSPSLLSKSGLEYGLEATTLFAGVLYIAIIVASRSWIELLGLLRTLLIIY